MSRNTCECGQYEEYNLRNALSLGVLEYEGSTHSDQYTFNSTDSRPEAFDILGDPTAPTGAQLQV